MSVLPPRVNGASKPHKRAPPFSLRIDTPAHNPSLIAVTGDDSAVTSAVTSATDDSQSFQFPLPLSQKPERRIRNMKKLSLNLTSAQSSTSSLLPPSDPSKLTVPESNRPRRLSVVSLPIPPTGALLRKDEDGDGSPTIPYADGPIEILPKIWLGSEENAHNWQGLVERGIGSILNVAREVVSPFDSLTSRPLRSFSSQPNLKDIRDGQGTYYPANKLTGRPAMHYLKLQWSHGQSDLVQHGFSDAMLFVDQSLDREEGVLVHCQMGISRSATLVIALVMRAAASRSTTVPPEVNELKGMQAAYSYVKSKSKWVGPNMSLIYQLLDYERTLSAEEPSETAAQDEEWSRRRQRMDEPSESEQEQECDEVKREARALDKAMEDRMLARKASSSSICSGIGMGPAWRSRYGRKRAGSIASIVTSNSAISEDLVEVEEEQELLGIGGGFDGTSVSTASTSTSAQDESERSDVMADLPGDCEGEGVAQFATANRSQSHFIPSFDVGKPPPPPSAPALSLSFGLPPPSAVEPSFALPPMPFTAGRVTFDQLSHANVSLTSTPRHRPRRHNTLPAVPDSPTQSTATDRSVQSLGTPVARPRLRKESGKPAIPPSHIRSSKSRFASRAVSISSLHLPPTGHNGSTSRKQSLVTPSQTLFIFPPSPTLNTRTPSTMTLTSSAVPFPAIPSSRTATLEKRDKRRSLIGMLAPSTPTTAHSRVDVRGWVEMH